MGWLFSERWLKRSDLIKHLVENKGGAKVVKHCCVGNHLWMVMEADRRPGVMCRFIVLCLMKGPHNCGKGYTGADKDWWGYKDIDETMGPNELSCPPSYLRMCTAPENTYAYEWRQRVYAREAERKARPKITVGMKLMYGRQIYTVTALLGRRGYQVDGCMRMKPSQAAHSQIQEAT